MKGLKLSDDIDYDYLVSKTDGYSGADIANVSSIEFTRKALISSNQVCREAAMMPMRRQLLKGGNFLSKVEKLEELKGKASICLSQRLSFII